jgi:hypothetical protein
MASDFASWAVCSFRSSFICRSRFLQKLDVVANDVLNRALRFTGRLAVLASEEDDNPVSRIRSNPLSIFVIMADGRLTFLPSIVVRSTWEETAEPTLERS